MNRKQEILNQIQSLQNELKQIDSEGFVSLGEIDVKEGDVLEVKVKKVSVGANGQRIILVEGDDIYLDSRVLARKPKNKNKLYTAREIALKMELGEIPKNTKAKLIHHVDLLDFFPNKNSVEISYYNWDWELHFVNAQGNAWFELDEYNE